jgi:hypothetical protein
LIEKDYNIDQNNEFANDHVFVAIPQIEVEINLARWAKLNFGAGYQFTAGTNVDTYQTKDGQQVKIFKEGAARSPIATVTFLFGGFGQKIDRK